MNVREEALKLHKDNKGKIEIVSKVAVNDATDLSLAYTPGVAEPCKEIFANPDDVYTYTNKGNMIAVVTDGSAVLGLGNIGSRAGMPVMEGKAVLFKEFANVDAFPICVESQEVDDIVFTVKQIAPSFGGINLEDIAAPNCFEVERRLIEELDIPVFHDDQHGTAIVVLAAVINALKVVGKKIDEVKIVLNGAGAAGIAISNLLVAAGAKNNVILNSRGILDPDDEKLDPVRKDVAKTTNPEKLKGDLNAAIKGADVFIGVSQGNLLTAEMVSTMNEGSIVLAMANPIPEILPEEAKKGGAAVVGTGRSDFENQVNNVLVFPGLFRGTLDVRSKIINTEMKLAAANAIADMVKPEELNAEYIIPKAFNREVGPNVAKAVAEAAIKTGVNRI